MLDMRSGEGNKDGYVFLFDFWFWEDLEMEDGTYATPRPRDGSIDSKFELVESEIGVAAISVYRDEGMTWVICCNDPSARVYTIVEETMSEAHKVVQRFDNVDEAKIRLSELMAS